MASPYKIIFDPDTWPTALQNRTNYTTQNQSSQVSLSPQSYTHTPILIPDQQIIQNNSPAVAYAKTDQAEEGWPVEYLANQKHQSNYIQEGISKQDIAQIIDEKIANLKVYVLESDITQAQNSIKSVVELASF